MFDQLKRALLAGLGVVLYTREKVEEVIRHFVETGQLTREQGTAIIEELVKKGKDGQEEIVTTIVDRLGPVLASITPVRKTQYNSLAARVDDLALRVEALEQRISQQSTPPPGSPGPQGDHESH